MKRDHYDSRYETRTGERPSVLTLEFVSSESNEEQDCTIDVGKEGEERGRGTGKEREVLGENDFPNVILFIL